jgi:hypothetical protein
MKKKILIVSIFVVLLMLSMPMILNLQAQPIPMTEINKENECNICPDFDACDYPIRCRITGAILNVLNSIAGYSEYSILLLYIPPIFLYIIFRVPWFFTHCLGCDFLIPD